MATWSISLDTALSSIREYSIVADDTKIYYIDDATEDIYQFDTATDSQSKLVDASNITNLITTWALAAFGGNLYAVNEYLSGSTRTFQVDSVDGVDTLTNVVTLISGDQFDVTGHAKIYATDSILVANWIMAPTDASNSVVKYSSDGSSWSTGSFQTYTPESWSPTYEEDASYDTDYPLGIFEFMCTNVSGGSCTNSAMFKFVTDTWTVEADAYSNGYFAASPNGSVHWIEADATYTSNFSDTTDVSSGGNIHTIMQVNLPYSYGLEISGSDNNLYQFNGTDYDLLDAPTGTNWSNTQGQAAIIRMSDDDAYMFTIGNSGNWEFWKRSEGIADAQPYAYTHSAGGLPGSII